MSMFAADKIGPVALARRCGVPTDFSGCYVLVENERAVYVGISRKVLRRLRQHVRGRTHFDASLAYRIAQRRQSTAGRRTAVMEDPKFRLAFECAKTYLAGLAVSFIPIENPLELYDSRLMPPCPSGRMSGTRSGRTSELLSAGGQGSRLRPSVPLGSDNSAVQPDLYARSPRLREGDLVRPGNRPAAPRPLASRYQSWSAETCRGSPGFPRSQEVSVAGSGSVILPCGHDSVAVEGERRQFRSLVAVFAER